MAGVMDTLERLDDLPALPESLVKIPPMLASESFDMSALCGIIRRDEALASAVLRRANSAMYNASGATFDLDQSIVRLGSKELVRIVTRCGASGLLRDAGASYGLDRGHLARGAAGGASIARTLAAFTDSVDPEMAYVCSLLRDIGKIVMDLHVGPSCHVVPVSSESTGQTRVSFLQLERERHGADHAQVGRALAERWGLPAPIPEAIAFHHEPPEPGTAAHDELHDVVHASDIITLWAGLAIGSEGLAYRISPHVRDGLLADRSRCEELISRAWDEARMFENEQYDTANTGEASA